MENFTKKFCACKNILNYWKGGKKIFEKTFILQTFHNHALVIEKIVRKENPTSKYVYRKIVATNVINLCFSKKHLKHKFFWRKWNKNVHKHKMKQMKLRTKKLLVKKWLKKFGKGENWKQNFGRKNMNNSKNETIEQNFGMEIKLANKSSRKKWRVNYSHN